MPGFGLIATTVTTPVAAASNQYNLWLGGINIFGAGVDLDSIVLTDTGVADPNELEFDLVDMALATSLADGARVLFHDNVADTRLFTGDVTSRRPTIIASGRATHVHCVGVAQYLDRVLVVSDARGVESDRARVTYLIGSYGAALPDHAVTQIASTNGALPAATFRGMTLRTAIEQTAALAGPNRRYYLDRFGTLHYFDSSEGTAAPYAVRIGTPSGSEIAPEDFVIDYDSSGIVNAYYVRGKTAAGSTWVADGTSIALYGRREAYIDAPDADTNAKAVAVGNAALQDTKNPIPRGSFTAKSPYDGWLAGQTLTVASAPQYGLTNATFQLARVTTTWLSGAGTRQYAIEFGALRRSLVRSFGNMDGPPRQVG